MTVRLSEAQASWLRQIRGGKNTSPPIPAAVVRTLIAKKLIEEFRDHRSTVRYKLTEEAWTYF